MLTILVAAVVGGLASLALDALRWRREDHQRWNPDRRAAYEAFVTSVDQWDELDHHAAMNGELEEWYEAPLDDQLEPLIGAYTSTRLRPRVNGAAIQSHARLTELELIGTTAVTTRAMALHDAMRNLSDVRYASPPRHCGGASDDLNAAVYGYTAARTEYVAVVRLELRTD